MKQISQLIFVFIFLTGLLNGQSSQNSSNLRDLPLELSWDDFGVKIRTLKTTTSSERLINLVSSNYLTEISNGFIRVNAGAENVPILVDLSGYLLKESNRLKGVSLISDTHPTIDVKAQSITLSNYDTPNSFTLEVFNFSKKSPNARQVFVFKGLDVFNVVADQGAKSSFKGKVFKVNVGNCKIKQLILKGGLLNLADLDVKIPDLCKKYNSRYFIKRKAFTCLEDCKESDPLTEANYRHVRDLVTKYNLTDYTDKPISFLDDILLTQKGVGINFNAGVDEANKLKISFKKKEEETAPSYEYHFFPWNKFINLSFSKLEDSTQLRTTDPYGNIYTYDSKIDFSNVELIQFFNELKALITTNVY